MVISQSVGIKSSLFEILYKFFSASKLPGQAKGRGKDGPISREHHEPAAALRVPCLDTLLGYGTFE